MKIRTSFVTNSSGSSSSRIVIENKVLCEILKKYTDEINAALPSGGKVEIADFNNGVIEDRGSSDEREDEFWYWSYQDVKPHLEEIPDSYVDFLKNKVMFYSEDKIINNIFKELKSELDEKRLLINESYTKIIKESDYSGDGGSDKNKGVYDIRNKCPKCGDVLVYTKYIGDNYCDKKVIDEKIVCSNKACKYNRIMRNERITGIEYKSPFYDFDSEEFDEYLPF